MTGKKVSQLNLIHPYNSVGVLVLSYNIVGKYLNSDAAIVSMS